MGWKTLILAAALLTPLVGAESASEEAAGSSIPPFLLTASVDAPGGARSDATLGVDPAASASYDRGLDAPAPPPPPGGGWAEAYFLDGSNHSARLARDLVGPAARANWTLLADADGPAGTLTLSWNRTQLAAFPETFTLNATVDGRTFDLRDEPTLRVAKPAGPATVQVAVSIERMWGGVPDAPQGLVALPGPGLGQATLSWSAPASDGGHALRGYVVYRGDNGSAPRPIARTNATTLLDSGLPLGASYQYAVSATNRLGEGNLSGAALALGTGKPAAITPQPAGAGERDERVLDAEAPLPSAGLRVPATDAPLLDLHARPDTLDGRMYDVSVQAADQPREEFAFFTLVEVPVPVDATLLSLPGADAQTPQGGARAVLEARYQKDAWLPSALVIRSGADAGTAQWNDATALP
jgi:hypothetical protein